MQNPGISFNATFLEVPALPEWAMPEKAAPTPSQIALLAGCLDVTSLRATDTENTIAQLLSKAQQAEALSPQGVAAVCIHQPFILQALLALRKTSIKVATVAGGFPHGQVDETIKCTEVAHCAAAGADEIDIVINRAYPLTGDWRQLYHEVAACKQAAKGALLKVILATGELSSAEMIYQASMASMMAGADFIKTSTGFESVNATLPAGVAMAYAIKTYHAQTNIKVGLKAAGGIRTAQEAVMWLMLVNQILGPEWLSSKLFRIGASSLLDDLHAVSATL